MKWTNRDIDFLTQNKDLPISLLAEKLHRSERAVYKKRTDLGIDFKNHTLNTERVNDNLLRKLIHLKFPVGCFKPNREFYKQTGIGQKRYGQLWRGEKNILPNEYIAIATFLNVALKEAFDDRQLTLFEEKEDNQEKEITL